MPFYLLFLLCKGGSGVGGGKERSWGQWYIVRASVVRGPYLCTVHKGQWQMNPVSCISKTRQTLFMSSKKNEPTVNEGFMYFSVTIGW